MKKLIGNCLTKLERLMQKVNKIFIFFALIGCTEVQNKDSQNETNSNAVQDSSQIVLQDMISDSAETIKILGNWSVFKRYLPEGDLNSPDFTKELEIDYTEVIIDTNKMTFIYQYDSSKILLLKSIVQHTENSFYIYSLDSNANVSFYNGEPDSLKLSFGAMFSETTILIRK